MTPHLAGHLTTTATSDSPLGPVSEALTVTVLGTAAPHGLGPLCNPRIESAFAPGCELSVVEVGEGLWSALRCNPDRSVRVLCVHNVGDRARTFDPSGALPASIAGEDLHFIHGHTRTLPTGDDGVLCTLGAHEFVWLARYAPGSTA